MVKKGQRRTTGDMQVRVAVTGISVHSSREAKSCKRSAYKSKLRGLRSARGVSGNVFAAMQLGE